MTRAARLLLAGALLAPVPVLAAGSPERAGAQDAVAANATAAAQAVRATVIVPRLLVAETLADSGGLVAQVDLGRVGGRAFASSVYPGDPATLGQVAGVAGLPRPPDSPLYVAASHPDAPESEAAPPGQEISAEAGATVAAARAAASAPAAPGGDGPGLAASASTTRAEQLADGSVVAQAESSVVGVSFPGGLAIGQVRSLATATLRPGASAPEVQTVTTVTAASVGGVPVEIGPDGITAPGPAGLPPGTLAPLEEQLRAAGISVRRIGGAPIAGGGSADTIEVRSAMAPPAPGLPAAVLVYRLGGATAAVARATHGGPSELEPPAVPPLAEAGAQPEPSAPAAATPDVRPPAIADRAPRGGRSVPEHRFAPASSPEVVTAPAFAPAEPAPASPDATATPGLPTAAAAKPAVFAADGLATLRDRYALVYLVVILAAVAGFAASTLFRTKGAAAQWSS